jgi:alkanesulfonate monooxygenase SsuD/methylene tetrahydromethanopterin reductase-like flavin-dependent oxidoreductase (luciferase family)
MVCCLARVTFGVFLPFHTFDASFDLVRDVVLECERLGYTSVHFDDHFMYGKAPVLECWTKLSALAAVTSRIRLGTTVLCSSFRNPALLAKMAATLDVISNGRLDLGVGAGVQESEHVAYGFAFPKAVERIERLKETVVILKKMWMEEKATYLGKYFRIVDAVCEPKPVQKPHPPITVGGIGENLTLGVQAEVADRVDWGYLPTIQDYEHKLRVLRSYCDGVGRDFGEIQKCAWLGGQIFLAEDRKELDMKLEEWKPRDVSLDSFRFLNFVGTPDEMMQRVREYIDLGVTHFMLFFGDFPRTEGLEVFAERVIKRI